MTRLMLVEDEHNMRELISEMIQGIFPCEIISVDSGHNAMRLLDLETDFCLIISDFCMPNGNGDELLKYVRERNLTIPFVFFTNSYVPDYSETAKNFLGVISKSDFIDLEHMIAKVLQNPPHD